MSNISVIGRLSRAIAFAAAAGIAAGAVAPAIASAQQDAPPAERATPKKEQKYCMRVEGTGSRMAQRECKTREAWIKDYGVDPVRSN